VTPSVAPLGEAHFTPCENMPEVGWHGTEGTVRLKLYSLSKHEQNKSLGYIGTRKSYIEEAFLLLRSPKVNQSKASDNVCIIQLAWITVILCDSPPAFNHQTKTLSHVLKQMSRETTSTHQL